MATIRLERIDKVFPNGHVACRAIDLTIADGESLVLVGPSGCGKSTLLRLIAGLETPTAGRILIDEHDVTGVPPQDRDLAMVFQSYALYPHMTVRDNLAYGLRVRRLDRAAIDERIASVAAALGLESLLERRPAQLSGGQRQRVALGRAMVRSPKAFLLDEPLSNLDPALRIQARAELLRLQRTLRATLVYVTHDQEEAMTLGHRVAVMREGRLAQVDAPLALYDAPANTFVATFIGSPPMNLIPAAVAGIDAPEGAVAGIRPHALSLDGDGHLRAVVDVVEPRGQDAVVHLRLDGDRTSSLVAVVSGQPPAVGTPASIGIQRSSVHLFDAGGTRIA